MRRRAEAAAELVSAAAEGSESGWVTISEAIGEVSPAVDRDVWAAEAAIFEALEAGALEYEWVDGHVRLRGSGGGEA